MSAITVKDQMVDVNDEGFLVNPEDWTEDIARALAETESLPELTDEHFRVIKFMRDDFKENGKVPTLRRMKKTGGVPIKDIYRLFPGKPAKMAAKVAGLGKPEGCI